MSLSPHDIQKLAANTVIIEGSDLSKLEHILTPPHLTLYIRHPQNAVHLKHLLLATYPETHEIELIFEDGHQHIITLQNLDLEEEALTSALALHIPAMPENQSFEFFQNIIAILRSPHGCPWDRKQTHQTLRDDFLQEAYELLDALDRADIQEIAEELGDVLLHVVIQAQIASEAGEFTMNDVLEHITEKMIFRHQHIFHHAEELSAEEVLIRWEKIKQAEREKENKKCGLLEGISIAMPSLSMAFSYQKRAAKVGFDWEQLDQVWLKFYEELEEFKTAQTAQNQEEELGDLLFSIVNLARWLKIDPETALRSANLKFADRVHYVEKKALEIGKNLFDMPLSEKDFYWDEYKKKNRDK